MSHETRDDFNGLACIVEQFKGHVIGFLREQTLDFHRSFAPLYGTPVLKYEQMLSLDYKCLHNRMDTIFTKPGILLEFADLISNFERDLPWPFPCPGLFRESCNPFLGPTRERGVNRWTARLQILSNGRDRPPLTMEPNNGQLALCWIGDQVPGLVAASRKRGRKAGGNDLFDTVMGWLSPRADVAHLSDLSPTHRRKLSMQIANELTQIFGKRS